MQNDKQKHTGISLFTAIQINFLTLKLAGLVNWSWIWVLSPAWIPLVIMTGVWAFVKMYQSIKS